MPPNKAKTSMGCTPKYCAFGLMDSPPTDRLAKNHLDDFHSENPFVTTCWETGEFITISRSSEHQWKFLCLCNGTYERRSSLVKHFGSYCKLNTSRRNKRKPTPTASSSTSATTSKPIPLPVIPSIATLNSSASSSSSAAAAAAAAAAKPVVAVATASNTEFSSIITTSASTTTSPSKTFTLVAPVQTMPDSPKTAKPPPKPVLLPLKAPISTKSRGTPVKTSTSKTSTPAKPGLGESSTNPSSLSTNAAGPSNKFKTPNIPSSSSSSSIPPVSAGPSTSAGPSVSVGHALSESLPTLFDPNPQSSFLHDSSSLSPLGSPHSSFARLPLSPSLSDPSSPSLRVTRPFSSSPPLLDPLSDLPLSRTNLSNSKPHENASTSTETKMNIDPNQGVVQIPSNYINIQPKAETPAAVPYQQEMVMLMRQLVEGNRMMRIELRQLLTELQNTRESHHHYHPYYSGHRERSRSRHHKNESHHTSSSTRKSDRPRSRRSEADRGSSKGKDKDKSRKKDEDESTSKDKGKDVDRGIDTDIDVPIKIEI
ncbi:hypothetical protein BGZ49_005051 [Haplosporangium sp. Z 27]|nr:hypothetical protein BGZ49_005051 [Haplosporangium sp. Z 27]